MEPRLILASASPRRARILEALGLAFRVRPANVDETLVAGESGALAAERLARSKAFAIAATETLPVLAADTLAVFGNSHITRAASWLSARPRDSETSSA